MQITKGLAYNPDIPGAEQFARDALRSAMASHGEVVDPDQIEITQGLTEGVKLVTQGAGFLNDGDTVRIAP
mgnify:CR=1 FL=1